MSSLWPGGFIASVEVRRKDFGPGRSTCWVRTDHPLVADEPVTRLAAVAGLLDITNGIAVRTDPAKVAFPNLDLTAHLLRPPAEGWLGLDTTVSFGPGGVGVTRLGAARRGGSARHVRADPHRASGEPRGRGCCRSASSRPRRRRGSPIGGTTAPRCGGPRWSGRRRSRSTPG
ncbi:hypothetical protein [Nocardioides convexus]|uniref:hypothetical protein n=1 Tax=Nocardioides convexus TaxID=2712224 RepID=UPI003100B1A9